MIQSTKPNLEAKIPDLRVLDNNPQKPVVRMANLCVVSAHTVRVFAYSCIMQDSVWKVAYSEEPKFISVM